MATSYKTTALSLAVLSSVAIAPSRLWAIAPISSQAPSSSPWVQAEVGVPLPLAAALATTSRAASDQAPEAQLKSNPASDLRQSLDTPMPDVELKIGRTSELAVVHESLAQSFEDRLPNYRVTLTASTSDDALTALKSGALDLAAIGRPLTAAEEAAGFRIGAVQHEKIVLFVSADHPFEGSLTPQQAAQILTGELTNWAQVGGEAGDIRVVDRPETSDVWRSLHDSEAFQQSMTQQAQRRITTERATGADSEGRSAASQSALTSTSGASVQTHSQTPSILPNPTQIATVSDTTTASDTTAVIQALGADGIGYGLAHQVADLEEVRIIPIVSAEDVSSARAPAKLSANESDSPFTQPYSYVYFKAPTPAAAAFLDHIASAAGQKAIAQAQAAEWAAVAAGIPVQAATTTAAPAIAGFTYSSSLAFSPKGDLVAAASGDGSIRLFDASGDPVGKPLQGLTGQISTLAFSPDGSRIVGASNDGGLQFWDINGTPIGNPLTGNEVAVTSIVFSPTGKVVASAGADGTLRFWDLNGKALGESLKIHKGAVNGLAFSPNGKAIASAGVDGSLRLWDLRGNLIGEPLLEGEGAVTGLAFSPSGEAIASAVVNGRVWLWDLNTSATGTTTGTSIQAHTSMIHSVAFSPNGEAIASGGVDGTLRLWHLDGTPMGEPIAAHRGAIAAVAFSPDGSTLLSGGTDGTLRFWSMGGTPTREPVDGYSPSVRPARRKLPQWIWWLLPVVVVGALWWVRSRRSAKAGQSAELSADLANALALAEAGNPEKALDPLERAAKKDPNNLLVWTAQGNLLNQLRRPYDALTCCNRALDIQADAPQALVGKAAALVQTDRPAEALSLLERAIMANQALPNFRLQQVAKGGLLASGAELTAKALMLKGQALLDLEQPQQALDAFNQALTHAPNSATAIAGRNRALVKLGEIQQPTAAGDRLLADGANSRIILLPQNSHRAYAYWTLSDQQRQVLRQHSGSQLALRLYDVTDINLDVQNPHSVQQFVCDDIAQDWSIPIAQSGRDYVIEVGYLTQTDDWLVLARSEATRVPSSAPRRTDAASQDSDAQPFWMTAGAELLIYGATEPDATVYVGDRPIPLNPDGTFQIRVALQDGKLVYPIRAIAADGEQIQSICMEFERDTPH